MAIIMLLVCVYPLMPPGMAGTVELAVELVPLVKPLARSSRTGRLTRMLGMAVGGPVAGVDFEYVSCITGVPEKSRSRT